MLATLAFLSAARFAPVTLEVNAMSAEQALQQFAQASGLPIRLGRGLEKEILVLRFHETPAEEAMEQIRWAVRGHWDTADGSYTLRPDSDSRKRETEEKLNRAANLIYQHAQNQASVERPLPQIVADLKLYLALLDKQKEKPLSTEEKREMARIQPHASPPMMLGGLLAKSLSLAEIKAGLQGGRVVYSSQPTPEQLPLPDGMARAMQSYIALQKQLGQAAELQDVQGNSRFGFGQRAAFDPELLTISLSPSESLQLEIVVTMFSKERSIRQGVFFPTSPSAIPLVPGNLVDVPDQAKFKLSPQAVSLNVVWSERPNQQISPEMINQAREILRDQSAEPLAVTTGEALLEWSRITNRPLAAALPDNAVPTVDPHGPPEVTLKGLVATIVQLGGLEQNPERPIGLRPADVSVLDQRIPRSVLAHWLEQTEQAGNASFEGWMNLAAQTSNDAETAATLRVASRAFGQSLETVTEPMALRLAAMVVSRNGARKDGYWSIPVGGASGALRDQLRQLFVRRFVPVQVLNGDFEPPSQMYQPGVQAFDMNSPAYEPTFTYGRGFGPNAELVVRQEEGIRAEYMSPDGRSSRWSDSLSTYAAKVARFQMERSDGEDGPYTREINRYHVRLSSRHMVELLLASGPNRSRVLVDLPADIKPSAFADGERYAGPHHEELKKMVDEQLRQIRGGQS